MRHAREKRSSTTNASTTERWREGPQGQSMLMFRRETEECAERCDACAAGRLTNKTALWGRLVHPSPTNLEGISPSSIVPRDRGVP
mmetsp:Transcript_5969/g.21059  ORF Transcript_5969/g.21059 Transcript_5969/m.21059 type:complete len:86 (+) Transcript_5969:227-484(+)